MNDSLLTATVTFSSAPSFWQHTADEKTGRIDSPIRPPPDQDSIVVIDQQFSGFTPLTPVEAQEKPDRKAIDCIVLHGFGAHPLASFQGRDESDIWIRDWLPEEIPLLDVMSYGYGTRFDDPNATGDVREWAQALSHDLGAYRSRTNANNNKKPLIFIAHSLGGLVFKQAVVSMAASTSLPGQSMSVKCIHDVFFFGVPSQGMHTESVKVMAEGLPRRITKGMLNHDFLFRLPRTLDRQFQDAFPYRDSTVIQFYETKMTEGFTHNRLQMLVPKSFTMGREWENGNDLKWPIGGDHRTLVQFSKADKSRYGVVRMVLNKSINKKPYAVIHERFWWDGRDVPPVEERKKMLDWLVTVNPSGLQSRQTGLHEKSTCQWLFRCPEWSHWVSAHPSTSSPQSRLLWVRDLTGAGETIVASTVIERLANDTRGSDPPDAVAYYYCTRARREGNDVDAFLGWVVSETCRQGNFFVPAAVEKGYSVKHRIDVRQLREVLVDVCRGFRRVFIVIDSLDESRSLDEFLSQIEALLSVSGPPNIRLLVASRNERDIGPTFGPLATAISIDDKNMVTVEAICSRCLAIDFGKARVVPIEAPGSYHDGPLSQDPTRFTDVPLDDDPTRFTLSPDPNCPLCRLLSATLFDVDWSEWLYDPRRRLDTYPHTLGAVSFLYHCFWTSEKAKGAQDCCMLVAPGGLGQSVMHSSAYHTGASGYVACLPRGHKRGFLLPEVIPERFNAARARRWLQNCKRTHGESCNQHVEPVPGMKVIDCEAMTIIHAEPEMAWVALSYVWGHGKASAALVNVSASGSLLLPRHLPATVQHAIEVTRSLGLRYLWVDRYCINQQDETEKRSQISKMDIIYHGAELTLIAAAGYDETFGLPGVGDTPRIKQQIVHLKNWTILSTGPDPIYETKTSRWASRGWTFQEGILSRRRLVFTERQTWFECGRACWMEALGGLEHLGKWKQRRWKTSGIFGPGPYKYHLKPQDLPMDRWWLRHDPRFAANLDNFFGLIRQYSKRELTFESDSLIAIAGVCSHRQKSEQQVYLQGMPYVLSPSEPALEETYFCYGLSWFHIQGISQRRRPSFPSWTWVGWAGAVDWMAEKYAGYRASEPKLKSIRFEEDGQKVPVHAYLNVFDPINNQSAERSPTLCFEAQRVPPSLFSCCGPKQIASESSWWVLEDVLEDQEEATGQVSSRDEKAPMNLSHPSGSPCPDLGEIEPASPDPSDWTHWKVGKHWLWENSQPPDCDPPTFAERLETGRWSCFLLSDYCGGADLSRRRCLLVVGWLGSGLAERVTAIVLNCKAYADERDFFDHNEFSWETVRLV